MYDMLATKKYQKLFSFKTIDLLMKDKPHEAKLGDFWFEETDKIILSLNLYQNIERPIEYAKQDGIKFSFSETNSSYKTAIN